MRKHSLLCLSALLASGWVLAQDLKDLPPPSAPFVAPVPENADWVVTLQRPKVPPKADGSPAAPAPADRRIIEVQTTKTGKFRRDRITSADGVTEERWFVDMLLLWPTTGGEVAATDLSGIPFDAEDPNPSVPRGFPGVGWPRIEFYDKPVLFEKRPSYHYVHEATEAWIDAETRLPLAYKSANATFQFRFNPPPTAPLTPPDAYQKTLAICEKAAAYRKKLQKDLSGGR